MNASNPTTINGQTYPFWNISLAISQNLHLDGSQPVSFALRCVPSKLTGDETAPIQTLDSNAFTVYHGNENEITDPAEQQAFAAIQQALVNYLVLKGL